MADEAGFLELLVANERVGRWLDILMDPFQRSRHKYAIGQLQQDLQKGASYVEEAARQGVIQVLTKLLSQANPHAHELKACEKTMDAISRIIAVCSGPMACGGKVSTFQYGNIKVLLREGALGDGLGAKVWSVCHIMCRELVSHPEIYKDQVVLELGSGTGLVGLVAALAGAKQVILTDYEDQVLQILRTCMHMNTQAVAAQVAAQQQQQQTQAGSTSAAPGAGAQSHALDELFGGSTDEDEAAGQQQLGRASNTVITDEDLFDDAESVEDFDLSVMMTAGNSSSSRAADPVAAAADVAGKLTDWDAENTCVRHLDWQESADALQSAAAAAAAGIDAVIASEASSSSEPNSSSTAAPGVSLQLQYPVILGNEVMYEPQHAQLVAAAIKHRLQPGGRALLCCAVRDQKVFDTFRDSCQQWGLRYRIVRVRPEKDEDLGGIQGRDRDYEGGYLLMAVDHATSPAADWHRDDFQTVQ